MTVNSQLLNTIEGVSVVVQGESVKLPIESKSQQLLPVVDGAITPVLGT